MPGCQPPASARPSPPATVSFLRLKLLEHVGRDADSRRRLVDQAPPAPRLDFSGPPPAHRLDQTDPDRRRHPDLWPRVFSACSKQWISPPPPRRSWSSVALKIEPSGLLLAHGRLDLLFRLLLLPGELLSNCSSSALKLAPKTTTSRSTLVAIGQPHFAIIMASCSRRRCAAFFGELSPRSSRPRWPGIPRFASKEPTCAGVKPITAPPVAAGEPELLTGKWLRWFRLSPAAPWGSPTGSASWADQRGEDDLQWRGRCLPSSVSSHGWVAHQPPGMRRSAPCRRRSAPR